MEYSIKLNAVNNPEKSVRAFATVTFGDCFKITNIAVVEGREKEFVAMPSYMVKQNGKDGKSQYQDVCFPVTKEFREKLYHEIMGCYQREKEKAVTQGREQAEAQSMARAGSRQPEKDLPFR